MDCCGYNDFSCNLRCCLSSFFASPSPNQPKPPLPTAISGDNKQVEEGERVDLYGTRSLPIGKILIYKWLQTGGERQVQLNNANTAIATFTAPNASNSTALKFQLTVTDDLGVISTPDTTTVNVMHVAKFSAVCSASQTCSAQIVPPNTHLSCSNFATCAGSTAIGNAGGSGASGPSGAGGSGGSGGNANALAVGIRWTRWSWWCTRRAIIFLFLLFYQLKLFFISTTK